MARDKQTDSFSSPVPNRGLYRDRHGRGMRGPVTGPHLPRMRGRVDTFFVTVAHTVDYLRGLWPGELADVHFDVAPTPPRTDVAGIVERWKVDHVFCNFFISFSILGKSFSVIGSLNSKS